MGMPQTLSAIREPISVVDPDASSEPSTAFLTRAAASASPRNSSSIAALMIAARGSAVAGARDVGRRAVDRLEQRRAGAGRIQVRRGGPPDPAGDRTTEVGEDVAEEVVGDDHVVALRALDEVDARGVDVVVAGRDVRVLGRDLVERPLPEIAGEREDVRLVHQREVAAGPRLRRGRSAKRMHRSTPNRVFTDPWVATSSGVPWRRNPPSPAYVPSVFSRMTTMSTPSLSVARRRGERAQVDEEVELEAQLEEEAALEDAGRHVGRADGAEQDRVVAAQLVEHGVGQDLAGAQVAARR